MFRVLLSRIKQGYRTAAYPAVEPTVPERLRGAPELESSRCVSGCSVCIDQCPTDAIVREKQGVALDMGRCLFCGQCASLCPEKVIAFSGEYRLAAKRREDLWVSGYAKRAEQQLKEDLKRLFGRSLKLRQVSAGGCNACEADINVLGTIGYDLGRFGIQYVASPRHADGVIVTGPLTRNMELALQKTYDAVATPKIVIAVGACAISGGPYAGHPEVAKSLDSVIPVDLYIPGCPPHPYTILDGLLGLLGRLEQTKRVG
jgi:Ni,Fe-hydrogenase III small subunit/Pyruvate/2-oxoacid:ferredoxin oxidoreductase delta subunit